MKIFNATITHISSKGVQATGHRLPMPEKKNYVDYFDDFWEGAYMRAMEKYESSKFTAWVENIKMGRISGWVTTLEKRKFWIEAIEIGMSCQVIETGDKVRIVKLNT